MFRIILISLSVMITLAHSNAGLIKDGYTPIITPLQVNRSTDISSVIEEQDRQIRFTVLLALIPVVVAFSFIVFIFYRARRESFFKQKEAEFRLKNAELEMKALRTQINPHFIFNCLNSIHHYMHRNDVKEAGEYLVKFSQLIRYVLETSSSRMVSLDEDLEALRIYIELEQLRMQRSFEFEIVNHVSPTASINIPPMMMQPFVENSVWHGLNHRESGGKIQININRKGDTIECIIEDNGKRSVLKNQGDLSPTIKKTSMGMALIKERLEVVSHIYKMKAYFKMADRNEDTLPEEGTRITLVLPVEE